MWILFAVLVVFCLVMWLREITTKPSARPGNLATPPMFASHAVARMQKETVYTVETINHANAPYIAQKAVDDKIAETERLRQVAEATHTNVVTQNENATSFK